MPGLSEEEISQLTQALAPTPGATISLAAWRVRVGSLGGSKITLNMVLQHII